MNVTCVTKNDIREFAYKSGIDVLGFASPDCLFKYRVLLKNRYELGLSCSIEEKDVEKRINPALLLEDVKSIIAIAVSYNIDFKRDDLKSGFGIVSRTSWGKDYHMVLREKLDMLKSFILSKCNNAKMVSLVDNNPLLERAIAYSAGIGFYGKNNMIINEEYGSYIFLGELLLNVYFEPDTPIDSKCGDCSLCLKACPGKAFVSDYNIDANKCLSYATIYKGYLNDETIKKLGKRIYGCDVCQEVCPYNKRAKKVMRNEFIPGKLKPRHNLTEILDLDNKRFKEVFGPTSSSWRGKNTIIRNAIIASINSKDKDSIKSLKSLLKGNSAYLRGYSAYALSILDGERSISDIENTYLKETDIETKEFMKKALKNIRGEVFEDNKR